MVFSLPLSLTQRMPSSAIAVTATIRPTACTSPMKTGKRKTPPNCGHSYASVNRTPRAKIGNHSVGRFPSQVRREPCRPSYIPTVVRRKNQSRRCLISIFFPFRSYETKAPPGDSRLRLRAIASGLLLGRQRRPSGDGLPMLDGPM